MKEFIVPNDLAAAKTPEQAVLDAVETCGYCDNVAFAIKLALEEALTNAFRHGNKCDPDKQIIIRFEITETKIHIEVQDQGEGFQPDTIPDPTLPEYIDRPHGRGIMLMRAYLDAIEYDLNGRLVRMIKTKKTDDGVPCT